MLPKNRNSNTIFVEAREMNGINWICNEKQVKERTRIEYRQKQIYAMNAQQFSMFQIYVCIAYTRL